MDKNVTTGRESIPVIKRDNLPVKPPARDTIIVLLLIKAYSLDNGRIGALVLLLIVLWIAYLIRKGKEYQVEMFEEVDSSEEK